ncbi:hypothetical protein [Streptosporangium sp. CA-115845]|uniref:hypothetical protein n=1 Tax=Streptosporangium sp. CA-115845 TaxID=3240071 RepID=UPI003D8D705C
MPGPRDYTQGTKSALAHLSGGLCYYPGCPEPVLREDEGKYYIIGFISHIRAAYPNGPRFDNTMDDDDRRDIKNLIFLCEPHHLRIDKERPQDYSVETLHRWKEQREASPAEALKRLREVTPSGLKQIVAEGLKVRDDKIVSALTRLEKTDRGAAMALRSVIDELAEVYSKGRRALDPDLIETLDRASRKLSRWDPVHFSSLESAADKLSRILDSGMVDDLLRASRRFPER